MSSIVGAFPFGARKGGAEHDQGEYQEDKRGS
jgi:hypothetical protein